MLYAVIPAGGSGTRLWPLSRAGHPKFLHPLTGTDASLLQATVDRLAPLTDPEHMLVVTGVAHAAAVARQLAGVPEENILVEPSPRDSCAAIALAAAVIARRDPEAVMGSFAADHLIARPGPAFADGDPAGDGRRAEQGLLMTVGITPTRPETGYGYLQCGDPVGDGPVLRGRGVQGEAGVRRGRGLPEVRQLPVERRHVRLAGRRLPRRAGPPAAAAARRDRPIAAGLGHRRAARRCSARSGRRCRGSPSTTR